MATRSSISCLEKSMDRGSQSWIQLSDWVHTHKDNTCYKSNSILNWYDHSWNACTDIKYARIFCWSLCSLDRMFLWSSLKGGKWVRQRNEQLILNTVILRIPVPNPKNYQESLLKMQIHGLHSQRSCQSRTDTYVVIHLDFKNLLQKKKKPQNRNCH